MKTLLIVIDAQRAFADPQGSLGRVFGSDEIEPEIRALKRIRAVLSDRRVWAYRTLLVRSEYRPGQFTEGHLGHPLANLCVPGANVDCEWASGLGVDAGDAVVTKRHADASTEPGFRAFLGSAVSEGVGQVLLAGFQLTTCVRATALSTRSLVASGVQVGVVTELSGARASSYQPSPKGLPSRVTQACEELLAAGVDVRQSLHFDEAV